MIKKQILLFFLLGLAMVCQLSMARDISSGPLDLNDTHTSPPNLVMEPKYSDHKRDSTKELNSDTSAQKLQYEPVNPETTLLKEKEGEIERSHGAEYKKGKEVFVAPKAETVVKDEEIQECKCPDRGRHSSSSVSGH